MWHCKFTTVCNDGVVLDRQSFCTALQHELVMSAGSTRSLCSFHAKPQRSSVITTSIQGAWTLPSWGTHLICLKWSPWQPCPPIQYGYISCSDYWCLQWPHRSRQSIACLDTASHRLHLCTADMRDCGYTCPWAAFWAVLFCTFLLQGGFKTFWSLTMHTHKKVMSKWLKSWMDRKGQKWSTGRALGNWRTSKTLL